MKNNIILMSDSYKYSMHNQYPPGTQFVYSYIESRGGEWDKTLFFGLQGFINEYLSDPITMEDINEAEDFILAHGEPFNREGWEYILNEYGGMLPVMIKAVPEGTLVPTKNVLVTIENTDSKCFWLTTFLETALLRAVWYPTTVATNSYISKQIILKALEVSGDPTTIDFKLHDFGDRGVSSEESARIGGAAHLVNFLGTDTVPALRWLRYNYDAPMAGFSIPAMEHSTVTSWGRDGEEDAFRNMLKQNGKPGGILACVSDSYDIYAACELWGTKLKQDVIDSGATVVIRPDSGYPPEVVLECLRILYKNFGGELNEKGYIVLNNVRVIQGDGIDHDTIQKILDTIMVHGYSADNVAFGQGGALLQKVDRDTMKFAMKASSMCINNKHVDVFKDPITDPGKTSKKGRVSLYKDEDGKFFSAREDWMSPELQLVFANGIQYNRITFDQVRANSNK